MLSLFPSQACQARPALLRLQHYTPGVAVFIMDAISDWCCSLSLHDRITTDHVVLGLSCFRDEGTRAMCLRSAEAWLSFI